MSKRGARESQNRNAEAPLLREQEWPASYSHEDGDLVELFYLPALECATTYLRVTGYFNEEALVLAARGLDGLIRNGGHMNLIVGCTLEEDEVEAIERGYDLRSSIGKLLDSRVKEALKKAQPRKELGHLAWLVAAGHLDVKVAIPKDAEGRFRAGLGLFHAKSGLIEDRAGDRLVFRGSINETEAGWQKNCESFDVSCSWGGDRDLERVEKTLDDFTKLWENKAQSAEVLEVPEAVKQELLRFLPESDEFVCPPKVYEVPEAETPQVCEEPPADSEKTSPPPPLLPATDEELQAKRRAIWAFIKNAPKREDGVMVAVKTSMVDPWPHQLRAYRRMLDKWPFRLLIADEVGLGKTIEAGMILRHLLISERAKRVLLLVPKAVVYQWQAELYEKFNLLVPIYTGDSLVWPEHHCPMFPLEKPVDRKTWTHKPVVLVSSQLMRRKDRAKELFEAEDWDLILLDEAHHARRRGAGGIQEKGPNQLLALMQQLKKKTRSLLLLTATPMQVDPVEIWDLLCLLGMPAQWTREAFMEFFAGLQGDANTGDLFRMRRLFVETEKALGEITEEELKLVRQQVGWSDIGRKKVLRALRDMRTEILLRRLSDDERRGALAIMQVVNPVRRLMSRHTRRLLREYARKGLLHAPVATRDVRDVSVKMLPKERELYEAVEDYIRTTYNAAAEKEKNAVGFVMTIYRLRVASSFRALNCTLVKRLAMLEEASANANSGISDEDMPDDDLEDDTWSTDQAAGYQMAALQAEETDSIRNLVRGIAQLSGADSKAQRLVAEIKQAQSDGYNGAIVFTHFTDTMEYVRDYLAERLDLRIGSYEGKGGHVRRASGSWERCSKEQIKQKVMQGALDLLVCTDAAGEGLNLQGFGMLVNYDLPWNPMKVEQRIGRIDRIGQRHKTIRIVNLGYEDTIEADIYSTLMKRIGLFGDVVGNLQPILSKLPGRFERFALGRGDAQESTAEELKARVLGEVEEAGSAGFDIEMVSESDLSIPPFPDPPYLPEHIEYILKHDELLPESFQSSPLDAGAYQLAIKEKNQAARITPLPEMFDAHFESHQLFLPGGALFDRAIMEAGGQGMGGEEGTKHIVEIL